MARVTLIVMLAVSLLALQLAATTRAAELGEKKEAKQETAEKPAGKPQLDQEKIKQGLVPIVMVKQKKGNDQPNFWLVWLKPYENFMPGQFQQMIDSTFRPPTDAMSNMIVQNVPGADQAWELISQWSNVMQGLMSGVGGGNVLSGLVGGRRR